MKEISLHTDTLLRTVIIDDEQKGRKVLQQMLERFCAGVEVVGSADSAAEGRRLILDQQPDLVFLDIEMPHLNGFGLLESLGERNFDVVFVSAHERYAMQAIKYSALDYLLKPVNIADLRAAVVKAGRKSHRISNSTP